MSASPREELRAAAARLAAALGWPSPTEVDIKFADHSPLSVNMAEGPRPKRKPAEVQILQALRSARGSRTQKELIADTGLSRTGVYNATRSLISSGQIEESNGSFSLME